MVIFYILISIIVMLVAIMIVNTFLKRPGKTRAGKIKAIVFDKKEVAQHLSGMIKYRTITSAGEQYYDKEAFLGMHKYLEKTYPLLHEKLEKIIINKYSLLYKWKGTRVDNTPLALLAHMDVVPVDDITAVDWPYDAFSGNIAEGYVWGRGSIDMKGHLCAVMESVEYLLAKGFTPKRDIYIALGHDEESMGMHGAKEIAAYLKNEGVRLEFVIDEGGCIMDGKALGTNRIIATIGTCEKGYADIRFIAKSKGGHSCDPPKKTAVGDLARAIAALERHQLKPSFNVPLKYMLAAIGRHMKFPLNVFAANLFITRPLIHRIFADLVGCSMLRTTTAPTMLIGSKAPNVLAQYAEAIINFRISPNESIEYLIEHIRKVVGKKIDIEIIKAHEPSKISSIESEGYKLIKKTILQCFGEDYVVVPYLLIFATDARWYSDVADNVYRFQPFYFTEEDLNTVHATGERLSIAALVQGCDFFAKLIMKANE